jgi:Cu+-exporting ATPase
VTETTLVRDPVCGMTVDPSAGKPQHEHAGHAYHFCPEGCRSKFFCAPENCIEATDPVCGMKVDRSTAKHMTEQGGERFYFCSARCREKFEAAPETYLGGWPAPEPMPAGTVYTCPMHPEIRAGRPGRLPDLRHGPRAEGSAERDEGSNPELVDFRRRFVVGAVLTVRRCSSSPWGRCSACRSAR